MALFGALRRKSSPSSGDASPLRLATDKTFNDRVGKRVMASLEAFWDNCHLTELAESATCYEDKLTAVFDILAKHKIIRDYYLGVSSPPVELVRNLQMPIFGKIHLDDLTSFNIRGLVEQKSFDYALQICIYPHDASCLNLNERYEGDSFLVDEDSVYKFCDALIARRSVPHLTNEDSLGQLRQELKAVIAEHNHKIRMLPQRRVSNEMLGQESPQYVIIQPAPPSPKS